VNSGLKKKHTICDKNNKLDERGGNESRKDAPSDPPRCQSDH
jgi:hypothetical protein